MKSNVLRFKHASLPEPITQLAQSDTIGDTAPRQVFQTPLPTINFSFEDDANSAASSTSDGALSAPIKTIGATAALESTPHLLDKIQSLWKRSDLNIFIAQLFLDTRDGDRAGFPYDVAQELLFLAQLNLQIRAEEAAPLLGVSVAKAIELISNGDQLAQGHRSSADDVWAQHVTASVRPALEIAPGSHDSATGNATPERNVPVRQVSAKLSSFLRDSPPLPPSVRLDVTSPLALRSARGGFEEGGTMDKGLFRCLAKELSNLKIEQLVLSSLGDSEQCDWLPAGLRFVRKHCAFENIVLHVDLLSASENLLRQCIVDGTSHLVIYLNLASSKWRTRAQGVAAANPDYFQREILRLIAYRDEYQNRTGERCELSVASTSRRGAHALRELFSQLNNLPGLMAYSEVLLPPGVTPLDAGARGRCHCLAPFIEAHVRSNGHLVACAQDHSGYSFTADLTKTTFTEAWLGQAFRMVRQRVAKGEPAGRLCESCPHHHPA